MPPESLAEFELLVMLAAPTVAVLIRTESLVYIERHIPSIVFTTAAFMIARFVVFWYFKHARNFQSHSTQLPAVYEEYSRESHLLMNCN